MSDQHEGVRVRLERLGALAPAFDWAGLKLLDIGARRGAQGWTRTLAPFTHFYACEPDPAASLGLAEQALAESPWRGVTVVSEGLSSTSGSRTLYLTSQPGLSSIYEPNEELVSAFGLEREFSVVDTLEVPSLTLADAARRYGFEDVSLIKVDTQGSELEILKSGAQIVAGPVQAVQIEVEFQKFYRDQPLFSDVDAYLREAGFDFVHFDPVHRRRKPSEGPTVAFSQRQTVWAHAFFIRRPPSIDELGEEGALRAGLQQLMIALAAEHFDLAAERLQHLNAADLLGKRGFKASFADLEAYVSAYVRDTAFKEFVENWPDVVKDRRTHFTL